jgi:geranylgeranyl pyrophosphate synthase
VRLDAFRDRYTPLVQAELCSVLDDFAIPQLRTAAGHLLGRGKLFRPLLALATHYAVSKCDPAAFVPFATALELIHTFTLIHDDLPCMDDAGLRRGVASVHVAHGEALALLAGDALLNLALYRLATAGPDIAAALRSRLIISATHATHLVVEGQVLDLQGEGSDWSESALEQLHRGKTGALLGACCEFGALTAGADEGLIAALHELGVNIGLAFQMRDDLLSIVGDEAAVGKTLSTDADKAKATYPRMLGLEAAQLKLSQLTSANLSGINALQLKAPGVLLDIASTAEKRAS